MKSAGYVAVNKITMEPVGDRQMAKAYFFWLLVALGIRSALKYANLYPPTNYYVYRLEGVKSGTIDLKGGSV